ncbi:MAG: GntR family transcriptional regulator [Sciscionella sp.]
MATEATGGELSSQGALLGAIPPLQVDDRRGRSFPDGRFEVPNERPLHPEMALTNRRELLLLGLRESSDRVPLAQDIFDEIAIAIVEGRLVPGAALNSVELARKFGTSRTPVREALAALERQGVIVIPPRRKPYVAYVTLKQMKDIYDLRASLFVLASELVIDNRAKEGLSELWRWQEALERDAVRDDSDNYLWHNLGFRLVEVRLSGNEELQRILGALGIRSLQFRNVSLAQPDRLQQSAEGHRRLLLAYEAGDKRTAAAASRQIVMSGYRAIERSGVLAPGRTTDRDGRAQHSTESLP